MRRRKDTEIRRCRSTFRRGDTCAARSGGPRAGGIQRAVHLGKHLGQRDHHQACHAPDRSGRLCRGGRRRRGRLSPDPRPRRDHLWQLFEAIQGSGPFSKRFGMPQSNCDEGRAIDRVVYDLYSSREALAKSGCGRYPWPPSCNRPCRCFRPPNSAPLIDELTARKRPRRWPLRRALSLAMPGSPSTPSFSPKSRAAGRSARFP